jgi:hypothetical protein
MTAHTDIRPLSAAQIDAVAGAIGTVFRLPLMLQAIPTDPCKRRTEVKDSHDRHANTETPIATR